jgi:putative membrane protein
VTVARLVGSILLSGAAIFVVVATPVTIAAIALSEMWGMIAILVSTLLAAGASAWKEFTAGYGFRVTTASHGLQLRHGLLEQRSQTVPADRIQAVRLHQPFLWRPVDWWQVEVNVAGYGAPTGDDVRPSSVMMPVGSVHDALAVLKRILPDLVVDDAAIRGDGGAGGFTPSPRAARWVDPIGWRRNGFRADPDALMLRSGRLHRTLDVVPHARTQSIGSFQGPLQRRFGLAGFEVHSTPGPVHPTLANLASDVAARLVEEQSSRARSARRVDAR